MIIANIIGGLGNQMFQYASAKALSQHLNTGLKIDTRDFENYALHQGFELNKIFNCKAEIANNRDLINVLGLSKFKIVKRVLRRDSMSWLRHHNHIVEPHFNFWPKFFSLKDNIYLDGYWQSDRYFVQSEQTIRDTFTFKIPLVGKNLEVSDYISNVNAVSLHVRRGDYVTNSKNAFLGVCTLNYYQSSIAYIAEKIQNPIFFIFSDDIEWVKENLEVNYEKLFINHNQGENSHFDMQLMSKCKHHIIANSSFSWWGAWLNASPNKIVIAPKKWFASNQNDLDLIPSSWVRL
ncbi:MAG: alpha-1,2-fucosyltransferase [Nitrososphaeraceae archaeon]